MIFSWMRSTAAEKLLLARDRIRARQSASALCSLRNIWFALYARGNSCRCFRVEAAQIVSKRSTRPCVYTLFACSARYSPLPRARRAIQFHDRVPFFSIKHKGAATRESRSVFCSTDANAAGNRAVERNADGRRCGNWAGFWQKIRVIIVVKLC